MGGKEIVYFVGAGLSKALEKPGKPIPLMNDFVQVMAEYADSDDTILTTLAELENAKVFRYECHDCSRLALEVVGKHDRSSRTKLAFKSAFMTRQSESIEQLLATALVKEPGPAGRSGTALVIRFNYAINRFFSKLGWQFNCEPIEKFLRHQFNLYPLDGNRHTFVSFNYDLILDHSIQETAGENWNAFTGYGFPIGRYLECGKSRVKELPAWPQSPPGDRIRILKPHGSLNWLVPQAQSGHTGDMGYLLEDGPVSVPLTQQGKLTYSDIIEPKAVFPAILAVCIIPPTEPAKRGNLGFLEKTRCLERRAIEAADEVYVLGWSMPSTDQDQIRLIQQGVAQREKLPSSVTVVNRRADPDYFERIASTFNVSHPKLRVFNDGFLDYVHGATGG